MALVFTFVKMLKVTILDGYIDEPACLGVPPYISPYPRYIAGAIWGFDDSARVFHITIDHEIYDGVLELDKKRDELRKIIDDFSSSLKE